MGHKRGHTYTILNHENSLPILNLYSTLFVGTLPKIRGHTLPNIKLIVDTVVKGDTYTNINRNG